VGRGSFCDLKYADEVIAVLDIIHTSNDIDSDLLGCG
jgi:hypothetical protein